MADRTASLETLSTAFSPSALFDMDKTNHGSLFLNIKFVWEVLPLIGPYLERSLKENNHRTINSEVPDGTWVGENVYIGYDCQIEPGVCIKGPAWIGDGCILRHGLLVKENVIVGEGAFLGHATELKNCVLFAHAETPHFNYVGDSILGYGAHLGAGAILSNVRLDKAAITIHDGTSIIDTGLFKMGAIVGDRAQIGCNSVLNPGTIIGKNAIIFPLTRCRGVITPGAVIKESLF